RGVVAPPFMAAPPAIISAVGGRLSAPCRGRSDAMNGSGHLVHGMGTALETPVWPAITDAEAARVVQHFPDAGGFQALQWHSPRPFSAAALVKCGAGRLFLKRHHPRLRSMAALNEEHGFVRHV